MANQSFTERNLGMINVISLRSKIAALKESAKDSIPVVKLCDVYLSKIDNGINEAILCDEFIDELGNVAINEAAKSTLAEISQAVSNNKRDLDMIKAVSSLAVSPCAYVAPVLESLVADYMINKCAETRSAAISKLSLFDHVPAVRNIMESLSYDEYDEKMGKSLKNVELKKEFMVEAEQEKTYTQAEVDKLLAEKSAEAVREAELPKKTCADIESHIGLNSMIRNILKECKNEKLRVICERYIQALNSGRNEVLLYESFVSAISPWNYLSAVDTQLSSLSDRVSKYKQDIDLKKILETMKTTGSYYIVPLIEDCVADYVDHKSMTNRVVLRNRLYPFESDPFVRDIISVIDNDLSLENSVYLGESVETLNNYVHTELVYSPVQYIKENECVFNVKGTYYVKKGTSLSKLKDSTVLSESFRKLCNLVNSSSVVISSMENTIAVYDGSDVITISESSIKLNDTDITTDELRSLAESAVNMRDEKANFYCNAVALNEGFNDIAYIDFVKRVSSNDGSRRAVDVFKIKNKIFIDTIDENLQASTFYKDVNPIQCRSIINEHMEINVAPLFEDELPDQKGIENKIDKKKKEYEDYIDELHDKKETLEAMKGEAADTKDIDDAIDLIDQEIADAEKDYKNYKEESEKYLKGDKDGAESSIDDEIPDDLKDDEPEDKEPEDKSDDKDPEGDELLSKESPEDMTIPVSVEGGEASVSDEFAAGADDFDEYADVADFDGMLDAPAPADDTDPAFKVVKVSYNKNLKTGVEKPQGEVIVIIPMVDANGDIHDEMKKVTFMLDTDKKPIINNEYMPLDMYEAIVSAIESAPSTKSVSVSQNAPAVISNNDDDDFDFSFGEPASSAEAPAEPASPVDNLDDVPDDLTDDIAKLPAEDKNEKPEDDEDNKKSGEYPIELGIDIEDVKPISKDDFEKSLDDLGIAHTEAEGVDGGICVTIGNKAEAHAFRNYFKEWKDFSNGEFVNFFPELERCFKNNSSTVPVMSEGVKILDVKGLNESVVENDRMSVMLPNTEAYSKMLGIDFDRNAESFHIVTESRKESYELYEKLYKYSKKMNESIDQDALDILEKYAPVYESEVIKNNTYSVTVPYSNLLESKLESRGIKVSVNDGNMSMKLFSNDFGKARKVFESFYGKAAPVEVRDFFQFADESLNENVKITVRDESTGKTVEINTDDALSSSSAESDSTDFDSSFKDITFDSEKSLAFHDDEESADDEDKKDDDKKDDEKESDKDEDKKEKDDKEKDDDKDVKEGVDEPEADEKPKKKFKFTVKKKAEKKEENDANESKKEPAARKLNESAQATVLDYVKCSDGKKGQIICQMANGDLIVNVEGHTRQCQRGSVSMLNERPDTLECPYRFDPNTLKGLYEQMVECGMFMNEMQLTPKDTYVKYSEYVNAKNEDEINLIIEGEVTPVTRKYVKITEDVNSFANINDYVKGSVIGESVLDESTVLVNKVDYVLANNRTNAPVRCLIKESEGWKLRNLSAGILAIEM